jgi:hypothetical protein
METLCVYESDMQAGERMYQKKGEKSMSRQEDNRVLARTGARELTIDEVDQVSAAMQAHTNVCTAIMATATATGSGDGDGCSDTDKDANFI